MLQLTQAELQGFVAATGFQKNPLEKFLKPFVTLTDAESEAIKAFYTSGILEAEAIFPDSEIQNKVKLAPSLLWKMQNIHRDL
jgi:hypothetical protein